MNGMGYDAPTTTRVPPGETDYLAKAAELLAKAAEENERLHNRDFAKAHLIAGRERIAARYAELGAIQRGQLPVELARRMYEQLAGKTGRS